MRDDTRIPGPIVVTEPRALVIPPHLVEAIAAAGGVHVSLTLGPKPQTMHDVEEKLRVGLEGIGEELAKLLAADGQLAARLEILGTQLEKVDAAVAGNRQWSTAAMDDLAEAVATDVQAADAHRAQLGRRLEALEGLRPCGHWTGSYSCSTLRRDADKPGFYCGNEGCPINAAKAALEAEAGE